MGIVYAFVGCLIALIIFALIEQGFYYYLRRVRDAQLRRKPIRKPEILEEYEEWMKNSDEIRRKVNGAIATKQEDVESELRDALESSSPISDEDIYPLS